MSSDFERDLMKTSMKYWSNPFVSAYAIIYEMIVYSYNQNYYIFHNVITLCTFVLSTIRKLSTLSKKKEEKR